MATIAEATFDAGVNGNPLVDEGGFIFEPGSLGATYDTTTKVRGAASAKFLPEFWAQFNCSIAPGQPWRLRMYLRRGPGTLTNNPIFVQLKQEDVAVADFQLRNEGEGAYRVRWRGNTNFVQHTSPAPVEVWQRIDLIYYGPDNPTGWEAVIYSPTNDAVVENNMKVLSGIELLDQLCVGRVANGVVDYWFDELLLVEGTTDPGPAGGISSTEQGLRVGSVAAQAVYVGGIPAQRVYLGSNLIFGD